MFCARNFLVVFIVCFKCIFLKTRTEYCPRNVECSCPYLCDSEKTPPNEHRERVCVRCFTTNHDECCYRMFVVRLVQQAVVEGPVAGLLLLVLALALYLYNHKRLRTAQLMSKIPGPAALPLFGNSLQINVDHDGECNNTPSRTYAPSVGHCATPQ